MSEDYDPYFNEREIQHQKSYEIFLEQLSLIYRELPSTLLDVFNDSIAKIMEPSGYRVTKDEHSHIVNISNAEGGTAFPDIDALLFEVRLTMRMGGQLLTQEELTHLDRIKSRLKRN